MRAIKQDLLSLSAAGKIFVLLLAASILGVAGAAGISLLNQDDPKPLPVAVEPAYNPQPRPTLNEPAVKPIADSFINNQNSSAVIDQETDDDQAESKENEKPIKPEATLPYTRSSLRSLTDTLSRPVDAVTGLITSLL